MEDMYIYVYVDRYVKLRKEHEKTVLLLQIAKIVGWMNYTSRSVPTCVNWYRFSGQPASKPILTILTTV